MERDIQSEINAARNDLEIEKSRVSDQNRIAARGNEYAELYNSQQGISLARFEAITQETKEILVGYVGSLACAGAKPDESIKYGKRALGRSWGDVTIKGWYFEPGGTRSECRGEKELRIMSFISLDLMLSKAYNHTMLGMSNFYENFDDDHIQRFVVQDLARRGVDWASK